jgi:DNA-binding IclR family transcriptional regulator
MREINIEPIRVLERAIHILNCFSFEKVELSIDDIVARTKLAKATAYRLLWTMERNGMIQYDSKENKYRLGYKMLEYGGIVLENVNIRREAEPFLYELFETTGHTVLLGVPQEDTIQYLLRYDSDEGFQPRSFIGGRRVMNIGALGTVMMAYMNGEYIQKLLAEHPLEAHTPHTVTDINVFTERLAAIGEQGFFVDVDETFIGFTAIAAPIFDSRGEVIGSIGLAGPSFKMEGETRKQLIGLTTKAAHKISMRMGFVN